MTKSSPYGHEQNSGMWYEEDVEEVKDKRAVWKLVIFPLRASSKLVRVFHLGKDRYCAVVAINYFLLISWDLVIILEPENGQQPHINLIKTSYCIISTYVVVPVLLSQKAFVGIITCTFLFSHVQLLFGGGTSLSLGLLSIKRRNLNYFWSTSDYIHGCRWFVLALLGNQPRESKT